MAKVKKLPFSADQLRSIFRYCPDSGNVYWLINPGNKRKRIGEAAGTISSDGYRTIKFSGLYLRAHRMAFYLTNGDCPDYVDHINGNRADNRWANLRPCTKFQNQWNTKVPRSSSTGAKGVRGSRTKGKFEAKIRTNGKSHYLGTFPTVEEAKAAYEEAARLQRGAFGLPRPDCP